MNLEHLCKVVKENYHRLKDERKALQYVRYQFELLAYKRNLLKLGAIVFDLKQIIVGEVILHQEVEMRYIRQDTSEDDELKLENRLEALKWRWDVKNVIAFLVVFIFAIFFVHALGVLWYKASLPTIAFKEDKYINLIKFAFEITFNYKGAIFFRNAAIANMWLTDTLAYFCVTFDLLF